MAILSLKAQSFVAERDVYFLLRLRNQSFDEEVFNYRNKEAIKSGAFNATKPTTFQIHGYMGNRRMKIQSMLSE